MIEVLHNFSIFLRLFFRLIWHQLKKKKTKRMIFIYYMVEITSILYIFYEFNN